MSIFIRFRVKSCLVFIGHAYGEVLMGLTCMIPVVLIAACLWQMEYGIRLSFQILQCLIILGFYQFGHF